MKISIHFIMIKNQPQYVQRLQKTQMLVITFVPITIWMSVII